jgi:hypothetical protein
LPGLDQLLAPPSEVLARADTGNRGRTSPGGSEGASNPADDPRRDLMAAPPPARGIFGGPRGYLRRSPRRRAGATWTMLNTKADRFAPFVRRVGTRVFQNLLIFQRRDLGRTTSSPRTRRSPYAPSSTRAAS